MPLSKKLLVSILVIFLANLFGLYYGWYLTIWWYDIPMHIAGGVWIAFLFFYIFEERNKIIVEQSFLAKVLFALGFVALLGVLWEFYEYLSDVFILKQYQFGGEPRGVLDTLEDLFNDLVGGGLALFLRYGGRVVNKFVDKSY